MSYPTPDDSDVLLTAASVNPIMLISRPALPLKSAHP